MFRQDQSCTRRYYSSNKSCKNSEMKDEQVKQLIDNQSTKKTIAFVSPQGILRLQNEKYLHSQGKTAENGGQVIYIIEMAKSFAKIGHLVYIFARNYESRDIQIESDAQTSRIHIFHIPTTANHSIQKQMFYPYYSEYLSNMLKIIEQKKLIFDAILGHYADGMILSAAIEDYYSSKEIPTALIAVTHSLGLQKAQSVFQTINICNDGSTQFQREMSRINMKSRLGCEIGALARTDGVICISSKHQSYVVHNYCFPQTQTKIIPNGVNEQVFQRYLNVERDKIIGSLDLNSRFSQETINLLKSNGSIVFGFGRLVKAKGVFNAVRSLEHILINNPNAIYVYAGGNYPPKNVEQSQIIKECIDYASSKGYASRIVFLGHQSQGCISKWLSFSQVYLHCGFLEPFGLAPIQAAATGIPCVISKYSGVAEILQDNKHVLHANPYCPIDIAEKVNQILETSSLGKQLSDCAVQYVKSNATWNGRAIQILAFIDEIAKKYITQRTNRRYKGNPYAIDAYQTIFPDSISRESSSNIDCREKYLLSQILLTGLIEEQSQFMKLNFSYEQPSSSMNDKAVNLMQICSKQNRSDSQINEAFKQPIIDSNCMQVCLKRSQ